MGPQQFSAQVTFTLFEGPDFDWVGKAPKFHTFIWFRSLLYCTKRPGQRHAVTPAARLGRDCPKRPLTRKKKRTRKNPTHWLMQSWVFLFLVWCSNLIVFSQETDQFEQQACRHVASVLVTNAAVPKKTAESKRRLKCTTLYITSSLCLLHSP